MANTLEWVEIRTRDTDKASKFYKDLFGWKVVRRETADGSDYWIFDTGGEPRTENLRRGALWLRPDDADHGVVVYVVVEDIEITLQKVTDRGERLSFPRLPRVLPLGRISRIPTATCSDSGRSDLIRDRHAGGRPRRAGAGSRAMA
ncbi:MAG: VOC family protein [Anaerolineae bacterium]|nr:VOC family protein [Anaerolineae bacterium]